jgi:hypothetical protein
MGLEQDLSLWRLRPVTVPDARHIKGLAGIPIGTLSKLAAVLALKARYYNTALKNGGFLRLSSAFKA